MSKIKNILITLIFVFGFSLASNSFAASKPVPGQVPVLPPLQAPMQNVQPNISGSIQSRSAVFGGQAAAAGDGQIPENLQNQATESFVDKAAILNLSAGSGKSTLTWIAFAFVALLLGGGVGYWLHVKNRR